MTAITSLCADSKRNERIGRNNDCLPSAKQRVLPRVIQITAFLGRFADHVGVIKEDGMPPLTTPATAVVFMVMFFVVMMGVPFFVLHRKHHAPRAG